MTTGPAGAEAIDGLVRQLFALVSEALVGATHALLTDDVATATLVVNRDSTIDGLAKQAEALVWQEIEGGGAAPADLRGLLATLLILPELERSADLAEHIAQRGLTGLGRQMSPRSRGIVQRMSEVGGDMWETVASAYREHSHRAPSDRAPSDRAPSDRAPSDHAPSDHATVLDEADEEMDVLHSQLTTEVATGAMDPTTAAQVTLLARFYERLGDHAVNLARRIGDPHTDPTFQPPGA